MARIESWFEQDLKKPVKVQTISGNLFSADVKGNLIGVRVVDNGSPATLGGTVAANVIRPDGGTVAVAGTLSGNEAYVILPDAAYAVPGNETIVIKITDGEVITTLLALVVTVYRSTTDEIVDPGSILPSIETLIETINTAVASIPADYSSLWTSLAPEFSSSTSYVTGQYVTYDGKVYRFIVPHPSGTWNSSHVTEIKIGNEITYLRNVLGANGIIDIFEDGTYSNSTWRGITLTWSNKVATLSGMATGGNFTSPNIFNNSSAFPQGISAGDIITININDETAYVFLDILSYVNGSWTNEARINKTQQYTIPNNATGLLLRLYVDNGKTVNGKFSFTITKSATVKSEQEILPVIFPAKDSIVDTIESSLNKYGIAVLGKGTYEIIRPINMPNNSIIKGAGEATVIKTFSNTDAIIAGASCTIEDVKIHSDVGHSNERGSACGIKITGNYDATPLKYNIKISNVTIDGFTCAGIYGAKTGTWVGDSISAVNCTIFNCYAGLLLEDYSEFGRYTNIMCRDNYIGVMNNSGNNVFENCSFSNNTVGVYLVGDDGDNSRNNGHGSIIGCTINHSNNNAGFAVICRGIDANGFVFDACQIWYGKIQIEESTGIIFNNCMFGAYNTNTDIINYTANDLFLMNCLFKVGATFSGSGGETHVINCFKFDGTPITN